MDYGTPMSFNGKSGYFLEDDEYADLLAKSEEDENSEYVSELETEVHNHRNLIDSVRDQLYDVYKELENA